MLLLLELIDREENLFDGWADAVLITLASEINLVVDGKVGRALDARSVPCQTCVDVCLAYVMGELVKGVLLPLGEFVKYKVGVPGPDTLEAPLA